MCKLSIIIPVYNVEDYLEECLDSVINQTFKDFEIICINDGSSDNSLNILNNYATKDKRINVISKENGGQASARNLGIKEARGDYVAFVDSDDFIKPDMFEKLYSKAKHDDLDIVMCKIALYDNDDGSLNKNAWYYKLGVFDGFNKQIFNHFDTHDFTCEISVTPYNKIYKKSILWDNNIYFPEGLIFEDEKFFYDVYLRAKKISLIDEFLYYYRVNRKGSTVDISKENDYSDLVPIYKLIRESFIETDNYESYKILLSNRLIHLLFSRFTQTSKKYQEKYYDLMKEDLVTVLSDDEILNNLDSNIKSRSKKLLISQDFSHFQELDSYKEFSVVIACYNCGKYVEETIKSILNQNFSFESNIQIILVDDGSTDNTADICKKFVSLYPNNIVYVFQENQGQGAARNLGLQYVKGKYVNFLDSDDKFSGDTFKKVFEFFEKHYDEVDLVSVPLYFFDAQHGEHPLNYKYSKDLIVTLSDYWDYPQLSASSAFFKKELFDEFKFDEDLVNSEDALMINQILLRKQAYGVVSDVKYWYRKRADASSTIDGASSKKGFYIDRINNYFKKLIEDSIDYVGEVPRFIQYMIVYDLQWMFRVRDVSEILSVDEIKELYVGIQDVLSYVEDKVILQLKNDVLNLKNHMLAIKHGVISVGSNGSVTCSNLSCHYDGVLKVYAGDVPIDRLNIHKFGLDIVEIRGNNLFISGYLVSFFNNDDLVIGALKIDNERGSEEFFTAKKVDYPNREKKFLNCVAESSYDFDLIIPLKDHENSIVKLKVKYVGDKSLDVSYQLDINFQDYARLSKKSTYSIVKNYMLEYDDNNFIVTNYSYFKMVKKEISFLKWVFKSKEPFYTSVFVFRLTYLILYPFFKNKRIWLFMDRRDSADDNAEHLYKYAINQKDGIKKYFVVSKNSDDFKRLSDLKNVLPFYSIKHRLIYLFSEKIISSHPDEILLNPFMGKNIRMYSGLINSDKIFLQHGVTKDNISSWLRKYDKNLSLLVTVSELERNSFLEPGYNYDESVIQVLGFPRFDNLFDKENNSKNSKQIVIMPSWREELHNKTHVQIKESQYFKHFNSLINNEKLIELAKRHDYKVVFKPHPLVYNFIELFDKNDYVLIDDGTNYQEIFRSSDLMITDYSSVAFDFSYMKKPVIYYQYGDDYNFKDGYFDYKTMGFGDVLKNELDIVELLEKYFKNNCKMEDKYVKRVDSFYKYADKNNCKRVYDSILNLD